MKEQCEMTQLWNKVHMTQNIQMDHETIYLHVCNIH